MIINVQDLSKSYKVKISSSLFKSKYKIIYALDNISFQLEKDKCLGILGPNGAGKTSLIKILSGILYPSSGKVEVCGFSPSERKNEFKNQIGFFMGGKDQLLWDLPAIDSLKLSPYIYGYSLNEFYRRINIFKEHLNIGDEINQPMRNMSLGQRKKMEIIYSFLHFPKIVFLDEPTLGLDFMTQKSLREFINICKKELSITFLITSHNIKDIIECCETTIIMNNGRIIFNDDIKLLNSYFSSKFKKLKFEFKDVKTANNVGLEYNIINEKNFISLSIENSKVNKVILSILAKQQVTDIQIMEEEIEDLVIKILK